MSKRGNTTLYVEQTFGAACEVLAFCLLNIFIIKFAFVYCFVPNPMELTDRTNQSAVKSEQLRWRCIYISGKNAFLRSIYFSFDVYRFPLAPCIDSPP